MNKNKILYFIATIFIAVLAFNAGYIYEKKIAPIRVNGISYEITNKDAGAPKDLDFSLFWDTWKMLKEKYTDPSKIDEQKMFYGAISGMVASVDDPYTVFMDPAEVKNFDEEMTGVFEGIGAEIGMKNDIVTIIAPLPDSPAEKAGLKAGDKIYKIDDKVTVDMKLNDAVTAIRGPKGTTVTLTILRDSEIESREFKIVRNTIVIKSAKLEFKDTEKGKIAVLKISRFGEDTFSEVQIFAKEILKENAKGIVLDLRNNPGGYLETSVDIAGIFLPKNELVVTEKYNEIKKDTYRTNGKNELGQIPLVILVNEGSASASEILAGALRDDREIKLVGIKTFGKGSVQEVQKIQPLSSAATLKVTVAEWLTPSGKNINKEGLNPDIKINLTPEDYNADKDPQMDAAIKALDIK